ncbi:hypothetical protein Tco_1412786, partial [Tanacetum coccineum]
VEGTVIFNAVDGPDSDAVTGIVQQFLSTSAILYFFLLAVIYYMAVPKGFPLACVKGRVPLPSGLDLTWLCGLAMPSGLGAM